MFNESSPIYRQIADQIKADILSGDLAEDTQVMSTNEYAATFRINPATAAKGLRALIDEGVLYKRRGLGVFVSADAQDRLRQEHRGKFFSDVVDPMITEAHAIGVALDEVVDYIRQSQNGDKS